MPDQGQEGEIPPPQPRFLGSPRPAPPQWKLPPGVSSGTWDYAESRELAAGDDAFLASTPLTRLDLDLVGSQIPAATRPGSIVADLGCGTGRALEVVVERGHRLLGIDLSQGMLILLQQRAGELSLPLEQQPLTLRANLVELQALADQSVDHAISLFSTLGMIRGRKHRRHTLCHVARILRPGGRFLLHVHNRWAAWRDPGGGRFLLRSWWRARTGKASDSTDFEFGDRFYPYRGLPNMFLHSYGPRELRLDLRHAKLEIENWMPVNIFGTKLLRELSAFPRQATRRHSVRSWFAEPALNLRDAVRAGGFMVLCRSVRSSAEGG